MIEKYYSIENVRRNMGESQHKSLRLKRRQIDEYFLDTFFQRSSNGWQKRHRGHSSCVLHVCTADAVFRKICKRSSYARRGFYPRSGTAWKSFVPCWPGTRVDCPLFHLPRFLPKEPFSRTMISFNSLRHNTYKRSILR